MSESNRRLLLDGAAQLGINLEPAACERLQIYLNELMKWNQRINLIARNTGEQQAIEIHFLDSLALLPLLTRTDDAVHLLDVGSGAGFPGLVLACVLPEAHFTLVEPRQKRVSFFTSPDPPAGAAQYRGGCRSGRGPCCGLAWTFFPCHQPGGG